MSQEESTNNQSRRKFLKVGAGVVGGVIAAGAAVYLSGDALLQAAGQTNSSSSSGSSTGSSISSSLSSSGSSTTTTTTSSTTSTSSTQAFQILSISEQKEVIALANAIIPTDSNGPGATTAGVAYFIDNQLNGVYGNDGTTYNMGPFILPNTNRTITVTGFNGQEISYSPAVVTFAANGNEYKVDYPTTTNVRIGSGNNYQYPLQKKEFWRIGLDSLEVYTNQAYGANFENLSAADQADVLTDLWNNEPTATQFQNIKPADFAYELFMLVWAGFLMDPMYGGNQGLVGWQLTGFNGVNMGNFYGEGTSDKQLMVASTPTKLHPVSLGQWQQASGFSISSESSSNTTSSTTTTTTTTSSPSSSSTTSTTSSPSSSTSTNATTTGATTTSSSLTSSSTTSTPSSSTSSSSPTSSTSSSSSGAVTIPQGAGSGLNFSPANITVAPGTTITWTDDDTVAPHNVDFLSGPTGATLPAVSPTLVKGDTFSVTLTVPGTYKYQCDFHAAWMQGTVTVS